ncbi:MAG: hypothetical protein R3B40_26135 [Polyangiales bacterium]
MSRPAPSAAPPLYVVSTSRVSARSSSQRYFAALLPQRRAVGGRLCVALRRLHTIVGEGDFDHLRVARYPGRRSLSALARSPLLRLLDNARRDGVAALRVSEATARHEPETWRELRAVWAITGGRDLNPSLEALGEALAQHRETHGFLAFRATLGPPPALRAAATALSPLDASELALIAFPSVRIAIDTLTRPAFAAVQSRVTDLKGAEWTLLERVSLREMLTP